MEILIGIFFAGLVVFHLLERVAPIHSGDAAGPRRRGYLADLTASLINGPVLSAATKIVAYWLVTRIPEHVGGMASWPWAAQLVVFLLVNDFGRYWLHRWYHASNWLWRIHRVHHTVVEMDALSTFRVHALEAVIKYGVIVLPFRLLGVDTRVLLLYSAVDILKGFWHHANLRTYIGRLNYVLNSAELHWWHHSTEARGQNANYGSIFSIWDVLFGTFYWRRGEWPAAIGVEGIDAFPETYLGQFASIQHDDNAAREAYHHDRPEPVSDRRPAEDLTPPPPDGTYVGSAVRTAADS